MVKDFNIDNATMAIRDYTKRGEFVPFLGEVGTTGYPFIVLLAGYRNATAATVQGVFWTDKSAINTINRPTTKMNVSIRGAKGRFISYKTLGPAFSGVKAVIKSLPNI